MKPKHYETVYDSLNTCGPAPAPVLARRTGLSERQVRHALDYLHELGRVRALYGLRHHEPGRRKPFRIYGPTTATNGRTTPEASRLEPNPALGLDRAFNAPRGPQATPAGQTPPPLEHTGGVVRRLWRRLVQRMRAPARL